MITGRLEDWMYDNTFNVIWGYVYDDIRGRFPDGTWIHTSSIPGLTRDKKKGDMIKTLNSTYLLGEETLIKD